MKHCCVLLLLLSVGSSWGAPVEQQGPEEASCTDPVVLGAAAQAMDKINKERTEGYVYSLRDLANAHIDKHGENSVMFYLTMNVLETNCSVLSKTHYKNCEVRDMSRTPVYGQCKVAIFISRVHRVVRLYKYDCVVRPVAPEKVVRVCPDCPSLVSKDDAEIQKTVTKSLEKFNKESGLANHFSLLQVTRASAAYMMGMGMTYSAEYTIQETTCPTSADKPADCPLMGCEFAHKGFCRGHHMHVPSSNKEESVDVKCEIYESEAANREEKLHLLGDATDHTHNDTGVLETTQGHDHVHDHTKSHDHHDDAHKHTDSDLHHHTHDHAGHRHAHAHSHDHGHGHDHEHAHHDKAHDHSQDQPNQHHQYTHVAGQSTHHHDHEIALDHEHKHRHLHPHEHHHHHHEHTHESSPHTEPAGAWRLLPPLGAAVTLPAIPPTAQAEVGVPLPLKPDPEIPGQVEPMVMPFPSTVSAQCPPPLPTDDIVGKLFLEDPQFKVAA
ncbi:unnamed protein product [Knipowitschia caucasica]